MRDPIERPRGRATPHVALALLWLLVLPRPAPAEPPLTGQALTDRITELETEVGGLRDESQRISGTRNPREGEKYVRSRFYGLVSRRDELDEVIEDAGGTQEELEAYHQQMDDQWVVSEGDVAGELVEKGVEIGVRRTMSAGASRALGWLGLVLDVAEYGGKWLLKEGDVSALEDAVEQNRVNLHDLYQVSIGLSEQIDGVIADMDRMEEIRARSDELRPELARLRERQRFLSTPARSHAVTGRGDDPAGDEEEQRIYSEEAAKRGIRAVGEPAPPIPKGVTPSRPQVDPSLQHPGNTGRRY